jgi:hypothetical protein
LYINDLHTTEIKDTIIMVSDILYEKQNKERKLKNKNYIYVIGYVFCIGVIVTYLIL